MRNLLLVFLLMVVVAPLFSQGDHRYLRQGDQAYRSESYEEAEARYRAALERKNSAQGNYNLGNSAYMQGNYAEAIKRFEEAARLADDADAQAAAYHNLGNAYFREGDYKKSVEAYKEALRIQPEDRSTKENLAKAQQQLAESQPPPQDNPEDSDEQQKSDNQDQQQPPSQDQNQQPPQEQDPSGNTPEDPQPNEQQSPQPRRDMTREEAERLLEIVRNAEEKTMEKMRQLQGAGCQSNKEW